MNFSNLDKRISTKAITCGKVSPEDESPEVVGVDLGTDCGSGWVNPALLCLAEAMARLMIQRL
jgi:hypothetical protein